MKTIAIVLTLPLILSACGPDTPPNSTPNSMADSASPALTKPTSATPGAPPPAAVASSAVAADAPPKGARYTIFCFSISGPNHTERAMQAKMLWQQATGRRDWYVIHQEDQSNLYFGYYRTVSDPKDATESNRAVADRQLVQSLKDSIGDHPFAHAMLLPLDAPDPTAPPAWNLVNSKGVWSVEVAAFRGSPDRKSAAVESVRAARAQGIDAYYYNGDAVSSVCIGSWPRAAIEEPNGQDIRTSNPEQSLMVVPEQLAAIMPNLGTDKQGNETKIVHNENKIVDPSMLAVLRQFPVHSLNGNEDNVNENGKLRPRPSFIVEIPHDGAVVGDPASAAPKVNLLGGTTGSGDDTTGSQSKLRSIGQ